jgi:hypothetical protein
VDSAEGNELLWYATQELRRYLAEGEDALRPDPGRP